MITGVGNCTIATLFTAYRRRRIMAFVASMVAHQHTRLATSVTAILNRHNVRQALSLAKRTFRTISFEDCAKQDHTSSWIRYDTTFGKTIKSRLGSCDAYVSHAWSDDGFKKFDALCEWALNFKIENGHEPHLWLDKDCVEMDRVSEDPARLPFFLSGSKKLLILAGSTYNERLWYTL